LLALAHHVAGVDQAPQIVRRQAGHHAPDGAWRQRRAAPPLVASHAGIAGKAQHRRIAGAGVLPRRDDVRQAARIATLAAVVARGPDGRGIIGQAHAAPCDALSTACRKARVRASRGWLKISSGGPDSTMLPPSITATTSATSRAKPIS